jgi:hypothetical protein
MREVQVVARGSSGALTRHFRNSTVIRDSKQFRYTSAGSSGTLPWEVQAQ